MARKLQGIIGLPSVREFKRIVWSNNNIPNCPLTKADVKAAKDINGPDVGCLTGKTVRRDPTAVRPLKISLPVDLFARYRDVVLTMDVMHANNVPFLVTRSRNIQFGTAKELPRVTIPNLMESLTRTINLYRNRGFRVGVVLSDIQFTSLRPLLAEVADGVQFNEMFTDEHVGDIKRYIRTL